MRQSESVTTHVSPTHDLFHMMFEGADMVSSFWQPMLKSVGRWHLEFAGLGMRHGQASIQLAHDLARSFTPLDAYAAHVRYWDRVSAQFNQSRERLAASTVQPAATAPLQKSDVVALPVKRSHDVLELTDDRGETIANKAA